MDINVVFLVQVVNSVQFFTFVLLSFVINETLQASSQKVILSQIKIFVKNGLE